MQDMSRPKKDHKILSLDHDNEDQTEKLCMSLLLFMNLIREYGPYISIMKEFSALVIVSNDVLNFGGRSQQT